MCNSARGLFGLMHTKLSNPVDMRASSVAIEYIPNNSIFYHQEQKLG